MNDPWQETKKLLGPHFFDVAASEEQRDAALEAEVVAAHDERREFSVLAFLAELAGGDCSQLRPGVYYDGDPEAARAALAEQAAFTTHHQDVGRRWEQDGNGGWLSGPC